MPSDTQLFIPLRGNRARAIVRKGNGLVVMSLSLENKVHCRQVSEEEMAWVHQVFAERKTTGCTRRWAFLQVERG